MKELFALTLLDIINIGFATEHGMNPDMVHLTNKKGNSIYIQTNGYDVQISVYKVSARCYHKTIINKEQIPSVITDIKTKLKL